MDYIKKLINCVLCWKKSHANKDLLDDQLSISDYTLVRKDRESGNGYWTWILMESSVGAHHRELKWFEDYLFGR